MYKNKLTGELINDSTYIMPDQWVNDRVVDRIRVIYPLSEELRNQRLGISDINNPDFVDYNTHVEICRQWGKDQKAMYAERASLVEMVQTETI